MAAMPMFRILERQFVAWLFSIMARLIGKPNAARTQIIEMETKSSMSVNPPRATGTDNDKVEGEFTFMRESLDFLAPHIQ
jgi:hypothetical protein